MGLFDIFKKKVLAEQKPRGQKSEDKNLTEKEILELEVKEAKFLFKYEDQYCDDNAFSHYSKVEYFLSLNKKIIVKDTSSVADMHSMSNNSSSKVYYYLSFEYLNNHIRNYNIPEGNKYLGISEDNCEQYL